LRYLACFKKPEVPQLPLLFVVKNP